MSCGSALTGETTTAPDTAHADGTPTPPLGQALPPPPVTAPVTTVLATLPASGMTPAQQYPPTSVVDQQMGSAAYGGPAWDAVGSDWEPTGTTAMIAPLQPFRITPLVVVASLAAVFAVASAFVTVAGIEVSDLSGLPATEQTFKLNDFASNLTVGAILAGILLIVGASLGATGRRVGTGLAGGTGLALAGMMGWMLGAVTQVFDSTEFGLLSSGGTFTLTTTRDIGFWLGVLSALLGAAAFVLSFEAVGHDGHPPIHVTFCAVGLFGTAMAVIGPMIPMSDAVFGDQFSNDFIPPATLLLRQLVLILIAVGGIVGFTRNRRWGLGMALGAISIATWQLLTAMTESGDIPLSYAGGNPGALDFAPHTVSILGIAAMIIAAGGGLIMAAQLNKSS